MSGTPWIQRIGLALALLLASVPASAYQNDDPADKRFEGVSELRARGEFDQAILVLQEIIREHANSEIVLRRAYNELIFSLLQKSGAASTVESQNQIFADAQHEAEKALDQFPDLNASQLGPQVNTLYNSVRAYKFVKLKITTSPDSCRVFLNEVHKGTTPLEIQYFPVGEYNLTVSKSGYQDRATVLSVLPGRDIHNEVTLVRERTRKWWLTRVVTPVVAGVGIVVAYILQRDDPAQTPPAEPLPGPPGPPATN